jgi:hypothetical protein
MQELRCDVSWYRELVRSGANENFAELPEAMTAEAYSFYGVDFYDEATGFVLHELYLENFEENRLPKFIRLRIQGLKANQSEPLDRAALIEHPEFRADASKWDKLPIRLRHESSALRYRFHGGREFDMMMKGLKPLSVFSCVEHSSSLAAFLFKYFDPLVDCGKLVSGTALEGEDDNNSNAPTLMYALPHEAWRIEAYRLMALTAALDWKWSDALERIQGLLLGYTPEQNDSWIAHRNEKGYRWGLQAAYKLLTDTEAALVQKTGCKAFLSDDDPIRLYLPHFSGGQHDPSAALANYRQMTLAKFYFPMVRFIEFSKGVTKISNIDFEIFELRNSDLAKLNELIDGTIDMIPKGCD